MFNLDIIRTCIKYGKDFTKYVPPNLLGNYQAGISDILIWGIRNGIDCELYFKIKFARLLRDDVDNFIIGCV